MKRTTTAGAVGVVAVSALVVALAANALLAKPTTPTSSPAAIATDQPSGPTTAPSPTPTPLTTATPTPTPVPTATPVPTPVLVPAPLTGLLVDGERRGPPPDRGHDRRPAGPPGRSPACRSASVVWQAPAEGGIPRYMAIFQDNLPESVGPVRSSRYYYIAWAAEWRALYAHAGGSPQAMATLRSKGNGQLRLQRRRVPLRRDVLPDQDAAVHRTTCTRAATKLRALASTSGRRTRPTRRSGSSRRTLRSRRARTAARSRSGTRTTRSPTATTGRPTRTCAR